MSKVSIIIPARGERRSNLINTLTSIYGNVTSEYEVIIGFNGRGSEEIPYYPNLRKVSFPDNIGIKGNLNVLAALARGKYLFKLDAHTAVSKGFDEILKQNMEDDWVVTPRFKILTKDWGIQMRDGKEEFYDYFYLSCPFTDKRGLRFKAGGHWSEMTKERDFDGNPNNEHMLIDETPQIHGSAWFMTKDRFFEMGGFPLQDPYGHGQEPIWVGLRNWLMGGKVMVNKKVWYAHLHQNSSERGYPENKEETERTYNIVADHFIHNRGQYKHTFEWFVEKFMPMPSWPENWRDYLSS